MNETRAFRDGYTIKCANGAWGYYPHGLVEELHRAYGEGSRIVPDRDDGPIPGLIQIVDPTEPDLAPYAPRRWILAWPYFTPIRALWTLDAVLENEGIDQIVRLKWIAAGLHHVYRDSLTSPRRQRGKKVMA